jgi:RNA polymerase sigma factor (sigma-70 family)
VARREGPSANEDEQLIAALRRGDADAFATLVDRHSAALIRVAMGYVPSRAAAQEVVQETWIAVMRGIDRFEGRASLKTWIFRILTNIAMRSGARFTKPLPDSNRRPFLTMAGPALRGSAVCPRRLYASPNEARTRRREPKSGDDCRCVAACPKQANGAELTRRAVR